MHDTFTIQYWIFSFSLRFLIKKQKRRNNNNAEFNANINVVLVDCEVCRALQQHQTTITTMLMPQREYIELNEKMMCSHFHRLYYIAQIKALYSCWTDVVACVYVRVVVVVVDFFLEFIIFYFFSPKFC